MNLIKVLFRTLKFILSLFSFDLSARMISEHQFLGRYNRTVWEKTHTWYFQIRFL